MDYLTLPRKPDKLKEVLKEEEDGSLVALKQIEIHIPTRFEENGFTEISEVVRSYLVVGVVVEKSFYFSLTAMLQIEFVPRDMEEVSIDNNRYHVLMFNPGDIVIRNMNVLQDTNCAYKYFTEFKTYARIPWYINDPSVFSGLFDNAKEETGKTVGMSPQTIRVFDAYQFRDPDNLDQPYRYSKAMDEGNPPRIVGLNNPSMVVEGAIARSMGGYLNDTTIATIVNPNTKSSKIEKIVKGALD